MNCGPPTCVSLQMRLRPFFNDVMELGLTTDNVRALESLTEGG